MKTIKTFLIAGILFLTTAACSEAQCCKNLPSEDLSQEELSAIDLTESEAKSLQWMREEEMLAHDVYSFLSELYTVPVFANISRSEMQHTIAVAGLLDKYGLEDPAFNHETGKFSEPALQNLYDELVKQGETSYEEAIRVGLHIEELDIADLNKALSKEVENEDIVFVYENLLRGSINHLNAFWFQASRNEIEYQPQHLSMDELMAYIRSKDSE